MAIYGGGKCRELPSPCSMGCGVMTPDFWKALIIKMLNHTLNEDGNVFASSQQMKIRSNFATVKNAKAITLVWEI